MAELACYLWARHSRLYILLCLMIRPIKTIKIYRWRRAFGFVPGSRMPPPWDMSWRLRL